MRWARAKGDFGEFPQSSCACAWESGARQNRSSLWRGCCGKAGRGVGASVRSSGCALEGARGDLGLGAYRLTWRSSVRGAWTEGGGNFGELPQSSRACARESGARQNGPSLCKGEG